MVNTDSKSGIVGRVVVEGVGTAGKARFDNMRSILLDMYFMGFDARAYRVSGIVSDMDDLGYDDWARVPQKVQARLMYDNYRLED
nr:MAG TPA: hypothetical protein [Caudoviricetes sp.]